MLMKYGVQEKMDYGSGALREHREESTVGVTDTEVMSDVVGTGHGVVATQ